MEFVFDNENAPGSDKFNMMAPAGAPSAPNNVFEDSRTSGQPSSRRKATRRNVATTLSDVEFTEPKRSSKRAKGPKVNYVKSVKKKRKSAKKNFEWSWTKAGWMVCGALVLRLVLMEGGIVDFNSMENTLIKKEQNLQDVRQENADLIREIHKLRTSPQYQKKITREHLGVIAKDEYLVLFSKDSSASI